MGEGVSWSWAVLQRHHVHMPRRSASWSLAILGVLSIIFCMMQYNAMAKTDDPRKKTPPRREDSKRIVRDACHCLAKQLYGLTFKVRHADLGILYDDVCALG